MKRLVISLFLVSISFGGFTQVQTGGEIKAKDFNNSTFQVGDIKHSLLPEVNFQSIHGDCWVRMRGQDIEGSDFANMVGVSILPNSEGRFLRDVGGSAPLLGEAQGDAVGTTAVAGNLGVYTNDNTGFHAAGGSTLSGHVTFPGSMYYNSENRGKVFTATAAETRPVNLAVNYFIKINKECN